MAKYFPVDKEDRPPPDLFLVGVVLRFLFTGSEDRSTLSILGDHPHKKYALEHLIDNLVVEDWEKRPIWILESRPLYPRRPQSRRGPTSTPPSVLLGRHKGIGLPCGAGWGLQAHQRD